MRTIELTDNEILWIRVEAKGERANLEKEKNSELVKKRKMLEKLIKKLEG